MSTGGTHLSRSNRWKGSKMARRYYRNVSRTNPVRAQFQDPGGNSALRAESKRNPRNLPCPTCHESNRLTPADVRKHYQCDQCADLAEGVGY